MPNFPLYPANEGSAERAQLPNEAIFIHPWPAIGAGVDKAKFRNKAKLCVFLQSLDVRDKDEMSNQGHVSRDQTLP